MLSALKINFYAKIAFASLLLLLLIINIVKTVQGVRQGIRTITPAIATIYLLFFVASVLVIMVSVAENKITKKYTDKVPY